MSSRPLGITEVVVHLRAVFHAPHGRSAVPLQQFGQDVGLVGARVLTIKGKRRAPHQLFVSGLKSNVSVLTFWRNDYRALRS